MRTIQLSHCSRHCSTSELVQESSSYGYIGLSLTSTYHAMMGKKVKGLRTCLEISSTTTSFIIIIKAHLCG